MRTARELDREQKWTTCLGCGCPLWTNRCHRFCRRCKRRNHDVREPRKAAVPAEALSEALREHDA